MEVEDPEIMLRYLSHPGLVAGEECEICVNSSIRQIPSTFKVIGRLMVLILSPKYFYHIQQMWSD